jgi:hypothetical protein
MAAWAILEGEGSLVILGASVTLDSMGVMVVVDGTVDEYGPMALGLAGSLILTADSTGVANNSDAFGRLLPHVTNASLGQA